MSAPWIRSESDASWSFPNIASSSENTRSEAAEVGGMAKTILARSFRKRKVMSLPTEVSVATCRTEVFFSSANVATRHDTRVSLFQADVARKVATSTERASTNYVGHVVGARPDACGQRLRPKVPVVAVPGFPELTVTVSNSNRFLATISLSK